MNAKSGDIYFNDEFREVFYRVAGIAREKSNPKSDLAYLITLSCSSYTNEDEFSLEVEEFICKLDEINADLNAFFETISLFN